MKYICIRTLDKIHNPGVEIIFCINEIYDGWHDVPLIIINTDFDYKFFYKDKFGNTDYYYITPSELENYLIPLSEYRNKRIDEVLFN